MLKAKDIFLLGCLLLISKVVYAQKVEIDGQVFGNEDVENIHVINKSSKMFTTTNALGNFRISAKHRDTIQFTSVQYKTATVVVSYEMIQTKKMKVYLEENVNVLDEVLVGKVLTGELSSDIKNSDAERPIDFYDVGIPGYKGKPLTQSERRLQEARTVQPGMIPILPLINAISGRTKMLKERVRLETVSILANSIKDRIAQDFFSNYPLPETFREEFFLYCSEDPLFLQRCQNRSDIEIIEFLAEKYESYVANLETRKD